jgi:hypothetical protein
MGRKLGGAVGTGLIIGSGTALRRGGPLGIFIGYIFVGFVCYLVMIGLGEMSGSLDSLRPQFCSSVEDNTQPSCRTRRDSRDMPHVSLTLPWALLSVGILFANCSWLLRVTDNRMELPHEILHVTTPPHPLKDSALMPLSPWYVFSATPNNVNAAGVVVSIVLR